MNKMSLHSHVLLEQYNCIWNEIHVNKCACRDKNLKSRLDSIISAITRIEFHAKCYEIFQLIYDERYEISIKHIKVKYLCGEGWRFSMK